MGIADQRPKLQLPMAPKHVASPKCQPWMKLLVAVDLLVLLILNNQNTDGLLCIRTGSLSTAQPPRPASLKSAMARDATGLRSACKSRRVCSVRICAWLVLFLPLAFCRHPWSSERNKCRSWEQLVLPPSLGKYIGCSQPAPCPGLQRMQIGKTPSAKDSKRVGHS